MLCSRLQQRQCLLHGASISSRGKWEGAETAGVGKQGKEGGGPRLWQGGQRWCSEEGMGDVGWVVGRCGKRGGGPKMRQERQGLQRWYGAGTCCGSSSGPKPLAKASACPPSPLVFVSKMKDLFPHVK